MPPYIGLAGAKTVEDAQVIEKAVAETGVTAVRRVANGILVHSDALRGVPSGERRHPKRYPDLSGMTSALTTMHGIETVVHYCAGERAQHRMPTDLHLINTYFGEAMAGIQLNVAWPCRIALHHYRQRFPDSELILQCGPGMLQSTGWDPSRIADAMQQYAQLVDHILIDPSGGSGITFDVRFVTACFERMRDCLPKVGVGVAGGLQPAMLQQTLEPLATRYRFSIDIESGVRDSEDMLDANLVHAYFAAARDLFCVRTERPT